MASPPPHQDLLRLSWEVESDEDDVEAAGRAASSSDEFDALEDWRDETELASLVHSMARMSPRSRQTAIGSTPGLSSRRAAMLVALSAAGCHVRTIHETRESGMHSVVVAAPEPIIERAAEAARMQMPTRFGARTFDVDDRQAFVDAAPPHAAPGSLFLRAQRIEALIGYIRDAVDPSPFELLAEGELDAIVPLHEEPDLSRLQSGTQVCGPLPALDAIRGYFGESVGFYFAFVDHLTMAYLWLIVPALITSVIQWVLQNSSEEAWITMAYTVVVLLWSTIVLETWKRQQVTLAAAWGMLNHEETERPLPSFAGVTRRGLYVGAAFVPEERLRSVGLPADDAVVETVHNRTSRRLRLSASAAFTLLLIGLVICAMLGFMGIKLALESGKVFGERYGAIAGGVINGLGITLLNKVYELVATRLNAWENHRTATEAADALIVKLAAFTIVNSYASLFYVAFAREAPLFGEGKSCAPDCLDELATILASVLITQQVFRLAKEFVVPVAKAALLRFLGHGGSHDHKLAPAPQLHKEYATLVVTFGYVTLFAAAFPLGALTSLVLGLIEARVDLAKFVLSQRIEPRGAEDIGAWQHVVEALSHVAVVTNTALLLVTSPHLRDTVTKLMPGTPSSAETLAYTVLIAAGIEHAVFALKYIVAIAIPDVPAAVREALALERLAEYRSLVARRREADDLRQ